MKKGTLYLLPTPLGPGGLKTWLSPWLTETLLSLNHFIAEDEKSCRRFLRSAGYSLPFENAHIGVLNEHTPPSAVAELLNPLLQGHNLALMSDAGCPGIADPGSDIVRKAHEKGIRVVPIPGPSSFYLALMASGLDGQKFTFHGYLPRERKERITKLKAIEQQVYSHGGAQLMMDTPYRNMNVLEDLLEVCRPSTLLCIATNVNSEGEMIRTQEISSWRKNIPDLSKKPCVFILGN